MYKSTRIMAGQYDIEYLGRRFELRWQEGIGGYNDAWHLYRTWNDGHGDYKVYNESYVGSFATKREAVEHIRSWHA